MLADLLDDGIANFSAGSDMKVDEKDFLDKAQEQAEKLKKLLTYTYSNCSITGWCWCRRTRYFRYYWMG